MQPDWSVEIVKNGINTISYDGMDSFTAKWTTGQAYKGRNKDQMHWTDYATGEDDIKIFNIIWNDVSLTGEEFQELMKNAANAIDECIASRL